MKKFIYYAFMILVMTMTASCITEDYEKGEELAVGDLLPAFEVRMNDGKILTRDSLKGTESMIVFFNTDCPDCRKELPVLEIFWQRHKSELTFACISRQEKSDKIEKYWKENDLSLPFSAQEDRKIYNLFAKTSIPRVYIADKNLIIRKVYTDNPLATLEILETDFGL